MTNDLRFLTAAYNTAKRESTDPSTQNGAVLVLHDQICASAANRFPKGVIEKPERWERPGKYQYVEHAERNVLFAAARVGCRTYGTTLYVPWFACADCARAIIQCGVREVVGHKKMFDGTPERWKESVEVGIGMLDEAGVQHRLVEGDVGVEIRFNGSMWKS